MFKSFLRLIVAFACASLLLLSPLDANAANDFVRAIQERGYLKVGLPPYNTPPAYYLEENSDELQGTTLIRKDTGEQTWRRHPI